MNKRLKKLFDDYNWKYWGGMLPEIEIVGSRNYSCCGEYFHPKKSSEDVPEKYKIVINISESRQEQRDTMLHEMCHHSCFLKNKKKYWGKRLSWHGDAWKAEMRRVGFKGRINQYT